jgi:conjugal transfer pilus assembly protein TraB
MADNRKFSSSTPGASVGVKPGGRLNPNAILSGLTKDVNRRWLILGGVVAAGVLIVATSMSGHSNVRKHVAEDAELDTTPKGISSDKNWKASTDAELLSMKQAVQDSQTTQKEILARMEAMSKAQTMQAMHAPAVPVDNGSSKLSSLDLTLPPPPVPPSSIAQPPAPPRDLMAPSGANHVVTAPQSAPAAATSFTPPADVTPARAPARAFFPDSPASAGAASGSTTEDYVKNDHQGFLPAGSFADATLISGVEAFTGGTAQAQPQPLVVRIDANAVLPNAAHYEIKGCHVLASVFGDMSSERVYGRLATLTCVDIHDKLVLSEDVEGVLVDSDGKNGIRGTLEDRQGAKLARSLLAGFAQGVASAFGNAQSTVTQTALGPTSTLAGSSVLRAGGYSGASTAANQIAEFYLKQAEATMPVIAVDAGRRVSVLFTKSQSLHFESTGKYRADVKNKLTVEEPY